MTEKNKVSIRNIRREANEELKKKLKEKKITEDESKNYEKSTQKLTDDHISTIDKITAEKEKEVLQLWINLTMLPSLWMEMGDGERKKKRIEIQGIMRE